MQYGFVIDHRKCIGCHACTVACKSENEVPVGNFRTWVKYTEVGTFPQVRRHFAVLRCNQCTNAPCVTICPVTALSKRDDGIVDLDKDVCIGCKACMQACPYDALYLNEETGGAEKCHFCAHRVEQGLKPACEVVCPEEAIISGDFDDPESRISRMTADNQATVRRPEQNTGPNVRYLGAHEVSLAPGRAKEPETYLWSDRKDAPPRYSGPHAAGLVQEDATTVLNTHHEVYWGWKVHAYLVTKGVAAGAAMLAPFIGAMGATGWGLAWMPEVLALLFTTITTVLLVADLKRPTKFLTLLTRPNTRSWLVKGAWVLMAFSGVTTVILGCRLLGWDAAADALRWPNVFLGAATAAYTAFLFAQCEGRDLWQDTEKLLPHLLVQAVFLGGAWLLPFTGGTSLAYVTFAAALCHLVLGQLERLGSHDTENARQAAALLDTVPIGAHGATFPGATASAFQIGLASTTAAGFLVGALALADALTPAAVTIAAVVALIGLFLYERAYVRAAQLPPLS